MCDGKERLCQKNGKGRDREASKKALIRIISTGGVFNRTEVNWIGLTPSNSSSCKESREVNGIL